MNPVFYILLGWLCTVFAAWGWGWLPMRLLQVPAAGNVAALYRFLLGSAWLSLLVFLLAAGHLIYKATLYLLLAAGIALLCWRRPVGMQIPWPRSAWLYAGFGLYYFFYALMPEMSPDGMSYHLGLVARYYREHGFGPLGTNMYAALSQGLEMLFLPAFGIGRHSSAALVHFTFLLVLPCLLALSGGHNGWRAGLFVFLLPLVGIDGVSAYNDVALMVICFAVFDAMTRWRDTRQPAWVAVAALLVGFAFSIKYTGIAISLFLLPSWRFWPRWAWAGLLSLPWLLKNYYFFGNPVAPFFNSWFPNPFFSSEFEQSYSEFLRHYGLSGIGEWAREVLFGGPKLSGFLGPAALLLPLGLFSFKERNWRCWITGTLLMCAIYPLNVGTRFLLPGLPFLAMGLFAWLGPRGKWALLLGVLSAWPTVVGKYSSPHTWRFDGISLRAAFRLESEESYLVRKRGGYVTARTIETFVPPGESVFAASPVAESYTNRNIIVAYQSTTGLRLHHALASPAYEGYQARAVYHCPSNDIVVARDSKDTWSITEIEPRPEGIECNRMPTEAPRAMDGNWSSRWRSWGPVRAGDWCRLTGQGPWKLWATTDQWDLQLRDCRREMQAASVDYRQEARRYFLREGVRYLAIDAPDFGSGDLRTNPDAWGIELVAERGTMRLYRWKEGK